MESLLTPQNEENMKITVKGLKETDEIKGEVFIAVPTIQRRYIMRHIKRLYEKIGKRGFLPTHPIGCITPKEAEGYGLKLRYLTKVDIKVGVAENWIDVGFSDTKPAKADDSNTIVIITGNHRIIAAIAKRVAPLVCLLSKENIGDNVEGYIAEESGSSEAWSVEDHIRSIGERADCDLIQKLDEKALKEDKDGVFLSLFAFATINFPSMPKLSSFKKVNGDTAKSINEEVFVEQVLKLTEKGVEFSLELYGLLTEGKYNRLKTQSRFYKAMKKTFNTVIGNNSETIDYAHKFYKWLFSDNADSKEFANKLNSSDKKTMIKSQEGFEKVILEALEHYKTSSKDDRTSSSTEDDKG